MVYDFQKTSLVNIYAFQIEEALQSLGCSITALDSEILAYFLLRTMGTEARDYHRPEHCLDVAKKLPPVAQLAALFHDLVYVQVDPTWERNLCEYLFPFIPNGQFSLDVQQALSKSEDPWLKIIVALFGFEKEEKLTPSRGLNEFLSAIVFYQKMKNFLDAEFLIRGLACIEATIPFRQVDAGGQSPAMQLKVRLKGIQKEWSRFFSRSIHYSDIVEECQMIVQNDLSSFSSESLPLFLSNTWSVMIEHHPALRNSCFSFSEYRNAIYGNILFFKSLDIKNLYWTDEQKFDLSHEKMLRRTERNLRLGVEYLKAVSIGVALVEAIALQTGGESAFELFLGPAKKSREHTPVNMQSLMQSLIKFEKSVVLEGDRAEVYAVLIEGRNRRSRFDQKTSPLSAWVYSQHSAVEFEHIFGQMTLFHQGQLSADDFLMSFEPTILVQVLTFLERTALVRRKALVELKQIFVQYQKNVS